MAEKDRGEDNANKNLLLQYAGIGAQILAGLLLGVFIGKWLDKTLHFTFPILIWLLPLVVIIGMMIKAVKDTSKKND